MADPDRFCWYELPVVSKPISFRDLLSDEFIKHIKHPEILDNIVTNFTYTPCTQIYSLGSDADIYMFVTIGTNLIDELDYDCEGKNYTFHFRDYDKTMHLDECLVNDFKNIGHTVISFDTPKTYDVCSSVKQDVMDLLRMKCGDKIVTKDGEIL